MTPSRKQPRYQRRLDRARWNRARTLVLLRDPVCRACGRAPSREIDHRFPEGGLRERWEKQGFLTEGDKYGLDNLEGLCHDCHAARTRGDRRKRSSSK